MQRLTAFFCQLHQRSKLHFEVLQDSVTSNNLIALRNLTFGFELFLLIYGILVARLFQTPLLNNLYLLFLTVNCLFIFFAFCGERFGLHTFRRVQILCMCVVIEVMSFDICISVFPFPDRPSIFFPLAYTVMLVIFHFRTWQIVVVFTAMTALFIGLVLMFKTPWACSYDIMAALTTWVVGFFLHFIVNEKDLKNGEFQMELLRQSRTDGLTELPNRRDLRRVFRREYQYCAIRGIPLGVIMLDVDHFKRFNDRFGHPEGDKCLMALGQQLDECFNLCGFYAARYGGEEFTVLLPGCGPEECAAKAQEMVERLHYRAPDGSITTVSLGVAVDIPQPDGDPDKLVQRADDALYRAKTEGRKRYVLDVSPELQQMMEAWNAPFQ